MNSVLQPWARACHRWALLRFVDINLRGVGQVMFQDNPLSGLLFLAAIAWGSWVAGAPEVLFGCVLALVAATLMAQWLRADARSLAAGLYGYNAALVGLALPTFLQPSPLLWAYVVLGAAVLLLDRVASTALLRPSPRLLALGAAAGGVMAAASYLLYPLLTRLIPFIANDTAQLYAAFRAPSPVLASVALVPVIVGEELVWRGLVQSTLTRELGAWRGVALAALVYALVHAPIGSPVLVAVALLCGLAWGILRAATASLVPALVSHLLWDLLVLLWLPLDLR